MVAAMEEVFDLNRSEREASSAAASRLTLTDSVYEAVQELVMDQHIEAGARVNIDLVRAS